MAFKNPFRNLTIARVFVFFVSLIFLTQAMSWLISSVFKSIPMLKTGWVLIFLSVGLIMILLVQLVFKGSFERKDFLALFVVGGITVAGYIYLPQYAPQIFSFFGDSAVQSALSLKALLKLP